MNLNDILSQLQEILKTEDLLTKTSDVKDLKDAFDAHLASKKAVEQTKAAEQEQEEETEPAQKKETESAEVITESADKDEQLIKDIREAFSTFKSKKDAILKEKNEEEKTNLDAKKQLLNDLRSLIQNEESLKVAFEKIKGIRDKWKEVGNIPRDAYADIQNEYSKLNETFNYNINIYKELKEHDLKRNFSLKNQIVHQIADLKSIKDIRTVEKELARLRNEWDEIGGTYKDKWEIIKEKYWENVKLAYKRIGEHYEDKRKEHAENLIAKKALLPKLKEINALEHKSVKEWQKSTDKIKAVQEEWKKIGFSPRKDTQPVWEEFRAICNDFFDKKQAFFADVKDDYTENKNKKSVLIEKANALKDSKDWRDTSRALVQLQKEWKKIGHAGPRAEHKLWKEFRGACDHFFNAKESHYKELESVFDENVKKKEDFIKGLEAEVLGDSTDAVLSKLSEIGKQYNALGEIPSDKRKAINSKYHKTIQDKINGLKIDDTEKPNLLFRAKIQSMADANDEDGLVREKQRLRRDLKKTEEELNQIENNLGFFSISKGSEGLMADVNSRIENEKLKKESLLEKIKIVNIALR